MSESTAVTSSAPGLPSFTGYAMPSTAEIPPTHLEWKPNPQNAMLLVHDMQPFFLRGFHEQSPVVELERNVGRLLEVFRRLNRPVGYTLQPGSMTKEERGLVADFWGPGMSRNDDERLPRGALAPEVDDYVFTKWRYSAFHNSDLSQVIKERKITQLVLTGVYANIGVLATAIDAYSHDIQVFLVADAIADFSRDEHSAAMQYVAQRCGLVLATDQFLDNQTVSSSASRNTSR